MAAAKKRRGGPSGKSGKHRQAVVTLRPGSAEQAIAWRAAAARAGLTLAAWMREALDRAASG